LDAPYVLLTYGIYDIHSDIVYRAGLPPELAAPGGRLALRTGIDLLLFYVFTIRGTISSISTIRVRFIGQGYACSYMAIARRGYHIHIIGPVFLLDS